jgi:hypothetical protein
MTAQEIFDHAFWPGRPARSDAYKLGVLTCLQVRVDGRPFARCPYAEGTAEADAYYAGVDEARGLAPVGSTPAAFDGPAAMTL